MSACAWCGGPIADGKRVDARTCETKCRKAWNRFVRAVQSARAVDVGRVPPAGDVDARRFGYADPPYPGLARRYYGQPEVDHVALIAELRERFPDGWALSTSSEAVRWVHALCPPETRQAVWVRGARHVRATRPLCAWEALLVCGGRPLVAAVEDVLVLPFGARFRSHPGALVGMKPPAFSVWLFKLLGARPGDAFVELFPGSGAVARAWSVFAEASLLEPADPGDASLAAAEDLGDASQQAARGARDGYPSRRARDVVGDASRSAEPGGRDASRMPAPAPRDGRAA